jgi:hypothetical protein
MRRVAGGYDVRNMDMQEIRTDIPARCLRLVRLTIRGVFEPRPILEHHR